MAVHGGRLGTAWPAGAAGHWPPACTASLPAVAEAADADVLATLADERPPSGTDAPLPGIRWVHVLGTGVDGFPLELLGRPVVTCSRGASAPAIAEFVLAACSPSRSTSLSRGSLPRPREWNMADLGGLEGRRLGLVGIGAIGTAIARARWPST